MPPDTPENIGKALSIRQKQHDSSWLLYRDCFNSNVPPQ